MVLVLRLVVVGALTVFVATGCGDAARPSSAANPAGKFPIVVAHPSVDGSIDIPSADVRGNRAMLLSPSQVAFMTTGSVSCAWWPTRLTVLGPSAIRIDMRVNGAVSTCGAGGVGFPVAVKIPRSVDVRRPVTVRLAYRVGDRRWNNTAVAPALSGR